MKLTINQDRVELDEAYMQMAEVWAKRSKGNRLQVGALIVKDRQIISDGYNGMPAGDEDDVCEFIGDDHALHTKPEVLHAESNALMKIAENGGVGAQGGTLYTTVSPCFECAKLIKQAKITRVVFRNLYRETGGIDMLLKRGVVVEQLTPREAQVDPFAELRRPLPASSPEVAPGLAPIVKQSIAPIVLTSKPSDFKLKPVPVQPPVLETPTSPKAPEPVIQPVSDDDIAALIAASGMSDHESPAPKKSTLADAPDGVYRSPFL